MDQSNPYQSPLSPGPAEGEPGHNPLTPKLASIRGEFWRGAKFGARICAAMLGVIAVIVWAVFVAVVLVRSWQLGLDPLSVVGGWQRVAQGIGLTLGAILLTSFYAAIAGSLIMGVAAVLARFRRSRISPRHD